MSNRASFIRVLFYFLVGCAEYFIFIMAITRIETAMFKCKTCCSEFESKERLAIHKRVHNRKSKVYEYEYRDFNIYRMVG